MLTGTNLQSKLKVTASHKAVVNCWNKLACFTR